MLQTFKSSDSSKFSGCLQLTSETRSLRHRRDRLKSCLQVGAGMGCCLCKGLSRDAGVAQVGKEARVLHTILVQLSALVLPRTHHCLQIPTPSFAPQILQNPPTKQSLLKFCCLWKSVTYCNLILLLLRLIALSFYLAHINGLSVH